jgi:hypothetical protein
MKLQPVAVLSTEAKESGHYFTPEQLARFRKLYSGDPAASYTRELYDGADVLALEARVAELERALGGVLFDFDDGVNGGAPERVASLDFARKVCPAVEFKRK